MSENNRFIVSSVKKYLDDVRCPNCGRLIDSIVVGKEGIRCIFCKGKDILEQFSMLSKAEYGSVVFQDILGSISESGPATKDENGVIKDSAWLKVHMDDKIFNGNIEEFLKNYVTIIVCANRAVAEAYIPAAKSRQIQVMLPNNEEAKDG